MKINDLCVDIRATITDEQRDKFYPMFKGFTSKRFIEVIDYIRNHHDIPNFFPLPAEFYKAIEATRIEARKITKEDYTPMKRENDNSSANEEWKRINESFKIMDIIREMVCEPILGARWNDSAEKTCYIMGSFYREQVNKGMVFDVGNKKWIPANQQQSIGGYYWNPVDWGNW